jgi:hypothetical protein
VAVAETQPEPKLCDVYLNYREQNLGVVYHHPEINAIK